MPRCKIEIGRVAGVVAAAFMVVTMLPGPASAQYRYDVDVRDNARAFVIAYENLTYSVDGGAPVAVSAETARKVDLGGAAGPLATITLSDSTGYVVVVADSADYVANNTSNDHTILARGRDGYVDTEFLVFNDAITGDFGNPGKMVVTATERDASVSITDLTDGSDTETGIAIKAGQAYVKAFSHSALFKVVSDAPVSVYYGIINDGNAEVMPTVNRALVGTESYLATPDYVGVVSLGDGEIVVSKRSLFGEIIVEQDFFRGKVTKGEGIYLPGIGPAQFGKFGGVAPVRVHGTTPFYAFVGIGNASSAYFGGTFIPPDPSLDPADPSKTRFYVQSIHPDRASRLDVMAFESATTITVSEVGAPEVTLSPDSTDGNLTMYEIPASGLTISGGGPVETTWEIAADKPVTVFLHHTPSQERGGTVLSPDYAPSSPPSIAGMDVTSVQMAAEGSSFLRVALDVLDVNGDLLSLELRAPDGGIVSIPESFVTRVPSGPGPYSRIRVDTKLFGLSYAYQPGTYTLTAEDQAGNRRIRTDVIRDVSQSIRRPATNNIPTIGAKNVDLSPVYAWIPPVRAFASAYRVEVSTDPTFTDPQSFALTEDSAQTQVISLVHAERTDRLLDIGTEYYWRVHSLARTIDYGEDIRVVGPTWHFTTRGAPDTMPPEFVADPTVTSKDLDKVTLRWETNELTTGTIVWGPPGFASDPGTDSTGSAADGSFSADHIFTFAAGQAGTNYDLFVRATDAADNSEVSRVISFTTGNLPDSTPPAIIAGPGPTSLTTTAARISWTTNEPAGGQINWYVQGAPGEVSEKKELDSFTLTKEMELVGLLPDTTYYYQVKAVDQAGNPTLTPILQFRSAPVPDSTAPRVVGSVIPVEVGVDRAVLTWETTEGAYSKVLFGTDRLALDQSQANTQDVLLTQHRVELRNLSPSTVYWYAAVSIDASRNEGRSDTLQFRTRTGPDLIPPPILPYAPGQVNKGSVSPVNPRAGIPETVAQWSSTEENSGRVEVSTDSTRGADSLFADRSIVLTFGAPEYARRHRVALAGLAFDTTYWAMIVVRDRAGNVSKGVPIEFAMPQAAAVDIIPPSVIPDNYQVSLSDSDAVFSMELTEPGEVRFFYGRNHYALNRTQVSLRKTISHVITLTGLRPGTQYYYKRRLTDEAGNVFEDSAPLAFWTKTPVGAALRLAFIDPPHYAWFGGPDSTRLGGSAAYRSRTIVKFRTNIPAASLVLVRRVGATGEHDTERFVNTRLRTRHTIDMTGLEPGVAYEYVIMLSDRTGNRLIWPAGSEVAKTAAGWKIVKIGRTAEGRFSSTFTTAVVADVTPPVIIEGPSVLSRDKLSAVIGWRTDEPGDSHLRFAKSEGTPKAGRGAGQTLTNEIVATDPVFDHKLIITGLDSNSTYQFEVGSNDPAGNGESVSDRRVFKTSAASDVTAPVISDGPHVVSKSDKSVVITWVTDEISDSQINVLQHGRPIEERLTVTNPDLVTEHVVTVTNLKPLTLYEYQVSSVDGSQNGPVLRLGSFTTDAEPDVTAPVVIAGPSVKGKDDITAIIAWRTDEPADSYVAYGATPAFGLVAQNATRDTAHTVRLTGLTAGTKYYFRIQSADATGNEYTQAEADSFVTDATADLTPPATPQTFTVLAGDGEMYLSWSANSEPDLAGYLVERSEDDVTYTPVATGFRGTSYLDGSVRNDTHYYYRVAAEDNSRNHNRSAYTTTSAATQGTPAAGLGPQAPVIADYKFLPFNPDVGYPVFVYYDSIAQRGEQFRPVFRIANVPPSSRPGAKMSYTFVVATDPGFQSVVATGSHVAPGDTIVGTVDTWYPALSFFRVNFPAGFDSTLRPFNPDTTSWIPSRNLTPGVEYYWRVRANDGVFDGPWSETRVLYASPALHLYPGRADYFHIALRPEEAGTDVWKRVTAVSLASFTADGTASGIRLTWEISPTGEARGAYLLRSTSAKTWSFKRLNGNLLPLVGEFADRAALPGVKYYYRIEVVRIGGDSEVLGMVSGETRAARFLLGRNRPNPFNPVTLIPYELPGNSVVTLTIYDVSGRIVRKLADRHVERAGSHTATWDGTDMTGRFVGSGVYIYRLERAPVEGGPVQTLLERMVLIR